MKQKLDYQVIEIKTNPEIELLFTLLFQTNYFSIKIYGYRGNNQFCIR